MATTVKKTSLTARLARASAMNAHPENGRTLCGRRGGVIDVGFAQCVRCEQILQRVDTSLGAALVSPRRP